MTRFLTLAFVLVLAFATGCPSNPNAQSPFPECAMPEDGTFSGRYGTNMGDLEMTQDGATVVGSWKDLPNHKTGRIEGTVRGCLLMFSWTQTDDMIPNMPRETSGRGVLQYVVDPAVGTGRPIHRFEGTWGYDQEVQGGGLWTGRKKREGM